MSEKPDLNHFETRTERRARKRLERKQGRPPRKIPRRLIWWLIGLGLIAGVWWYIPNHVKSKENNSNHKVSESTDNKHTKLVESCTTDVATKFHIHPHLTIIINQQEQSIPTDIGADPSCLHPLHTHDNSGIVHIESPRPDDFTLADFFKIWKKDYNATTILDQAVAADGQLKLFIDGQESGTGPQTVMQDNTSYVIIYGLAGTVLKPPANYKFPKNL